MTPTVRRAIAAVALLGIGAACGNDEPSTTPDIVSTTPDVATAAIDADAIRASSVAVHVAGCGSRDRRGAGTVIDGAGLVVTAAHVVAGASTTTVVDDDGNGYPAEVVFFDPAQDVAALLAPAVVASPAELRGPAAEPGDTGAIVVHHSDESDDDDDGDGSTKSSVASEVVAVEVLRTVRIRTTDIYHDADVERPGFEIDASVEPGDSGAMVFLDGGGAGIVWARSTAHDDRAWAVVLPHQFTDDESRSALTTPVDPGPCP